MSSGSMESQITDARSRRAVLRSIATGLALTLSMPWLEREALAQHTPQPMPSPNAPNQNFPAGIDGGKGAIRPNGPPLNTVDQKQIANWVQQLYELSLALKNEVEKTNLAEVMPMDFVKRAEQIEKLAKQIKQKAKG